MQASRWAGAGSGAVILIGLAVLPAVAEEAPGHVLLSAGAFDDTDDDSSASAWCTCPMPESMTGSRAQTRRF